MMRVSPIHHLLVAAEAGSQLLDCRFRGNERSIDQTTESIG
jgi:hypothetical protein